MNFFQLIYAYIKKNLKTAQAIEDPDERKKQWIKIVFGIVLALGYGGLHVPPNVSVSEVIYALGILFDYLVPGGILAIDQKKQGGEWKAIVEYASENNLELTTSSKFNSTPAYIVK